MQRNISKCRFCDTNLTANFLDLGFAPHSNGYISAERMSSPESYFPLKVKVCDNCWLVQTEDYSSAESLFTPEYAYFSSTSSSWLKHASDYVDLQIQKLHLDSASFVIEVASNDGYLLKNFVEKSIPCLGIEPTVGTARAAEKLGIPVLKEFFGEKLASRLEEEDQKADLIIGNNVYAHVPDILDFTRGLKRALKETGTITLEFPHLGKLLKFQQFDTVYHEHFSYLSLGTTKRIFESVGLRIWDVEELRTHGGSLRIYGCHKEDGRTTSSNVGKLLMQEADEGLEDLETYLSFQPKAEKIKNDLLTFLIENKHLGKKVVAYGAAAKGNTLLNFAGVKKDLIGSVFDAAPAKQGQYMPGSHIPIRKPSELVEEHADIVLILPWNISAEVVSEYQHLKDSGTQFVVAVPEIKIL